MNNRHMLALFLAFALCGCSRSVTPPKDVLVKINDYEITRSDFEREFKDSVFGKVDTPDTRKEFLGNLIDRKLILQYAETRGLDKKESFLAMVERFWEQSLLKLALDTKEKEIARSTTVSDREIEAECQEMIRDGKIDTPTAEAYSHARWEIAARKGSQTMTSWIAELRRRSSIRVNDALLGKE